MDKDYMETPTGEKLPEGVVPECLIVDSFSDLKGYSKLTHKHQQTDLIEEGKKKLEKGKKNIKDLLKGAKGAVEGEKPKEGEEPKGDMNNMYVYASWLTKEGILSGASVTIDLAEDGTYTTWAWGQEIEKGLYVEHVADSHLISYTCKNVGEDEVDQRVRVMVDQTKIPKSDEEYNVFRDAAQKAITEMQTKYIEENKLELEPYNIDEMAVRVNQEENCRYVE